MADGREVLALDLRQLPSDSELSRPVAEALAIAASVVLDRVHGQQDGYPAEIHGDENMRAALLRCVPIGDAERATYGDSQEATEEGGEGVAIAVARRALGRIVFRRLPKGTGADYLMRDPASASDDSYERLECSAIADGQESPSARLGKKLDQLARFPAHPPGKAVVTSFRERPVEVRYGSWSK